MTELMTAFRGRRSIRAFKQEKVPDKIIQEVITAGSYAPKPSNRQQWEIVVVDDKEKINRLVDEAGAQEQVKGAPCVFVVTVDMEFNKEHWSNIQATAAACQNMQLRAFDLGYGSCVMAGFGDGNIVKKILGVPDPWEVTCFMMLGKPAEKPPVPPKKPLEEVMHRNSFIQRDRMQSSVRIKDWNLERVRLHQKFVSRAYKMGVDYEFYDEAELEEMKKILKEHVPEKGVVLNMLGYDGTVLKNIQDVFNGATLIDCELSKEAADFVKSKTKGIKFVKFNDTKIEGMTDKSVDLVLFTFSLEKTPKKKRLLKEAHRVLKDDGKIILFVKNKASSYGLMYYSIVKLLGIKHLEGFYVRSGPFEPITLGKAKKLTRWANFNVQDTKGYFLLPAEIKIYTQKVDGYLRRHGHKLSVFKYLIKPALRFGEFCFNSTKWVKSPTVSASSCIIAKK